MLKFIPDFTISYRGVVHKAHETFDIYPDDLDVMSHYGKVMSEKGSKPKKVLPETVETVKEIPKPIAEEQTDEIAEETVTEAPVKKSGRPKKVSE